MERRLVGPQEANESALADLEWEEGVVYAIRAPGYRHRAEIVCTKTGSRVGKFKNGEHKYIAYVSLVSRRGHDIGTGCVVVPVLSDSRVLMIVDHRPALEHFGEMPGLQFVAGGATYALGPHESLEFPGGGIEPGEDPKQGILREFAEETGAPPQEATLFVFKSTLFPLCSDVGCANHVAFVYLTQNEFAPQVATDGGLRVFAMTSDEVEENLARGAVRSAQTVGAWFFHKAFANPAEHHLKRVLEKYRAMTRASVMIPSV